MASLPENSVDSIVTDPPYGLGFMGKAWDQLPPGEEWAAECLRVLKPGGHLLAFGGTRTWHRLAVAVEDAGFEIRDSIAWMYGSGFPKSLDVSKAIDKQRDDYPAIREVVAFIREAFSASSVERPDLDLALGGSAVMSHFLALSRSNAGCPTWEQWAVLKDSLGFDDSMDAEVWRLNGRKGTPGENWELREVVGEKTAGMGTGKTFGMLQSEGENAEAEKIIPITAPATEAASQWAGWGTALKPAHEPVVVARKPFPGTVAGNVQTWGAGALNIDATRIQSTVLDSERRTSAAGASEYWGLSEHGGGTDRHNAAGRWPANVVLDETTAELLDQQSGEASYNPAKTFGKSTKGTIYGNGDGPPAGRPVFGYGDRGGASRFFYVAKAPKKERPVVDGVAHPTVKPLALMRWLVKLVTPPGGTVLEPFAGSGATVEACMLEGFNCIAIEQEADYLPLINERIERAA